MAGTANDDLLPRPPGGLAPGALLALLAHAGLIAALAGAVDWRTRTPTVVSAELWASVPQSAAPRAPEAAPPPPAPTPAPAPAPRPAPPPAPAPPTAAERDAQIAIERSVRAAREAAQREQAERERVAREKAARELAAREKAERERVAREQAAAEKLAREKAEQLAREAEQKRQRDLAAAEKARREAEDRQLAAQREKNLERMLAQADAAGAGRTPGGTAARDAAPSATYAGRLIAEIKPNIVLTDPLPPTLATDVEVRAAPSGTILSRRVVRSSGNPVWDEAVLRAIDRTATLPRDTDGRVPGTLVITFRPS